MTYINNKNNRKLTPSEKAHVSYYTCIYMFEFFFSLIDFKHHNAKSKSQFKPEENEWTPWLCRL